MRTLYLISYDISDPRRLRRVFRYLQGYRVNGQKSVFECWITPAERREILLNLPKMTEPEQDRVHIFQLDPRQQVLCFGQAVSGSPTGFFIV